MRNRKEKKDKIPVELLADPDIGFSEMVRALDAHGADLAENGDVRVVLTQDLADPGLAEIHRESLARRQPWLLVQLQSDAGSLVGPLFEFGVAGCWACLRRRLLVNGWSGRRGPDSGKVSYKACQFVARWVSALRRNGVAKPPRIAELARTGRVARWHAVTPYGDCPDCSSGERRLSRSPAERVSPLSGVVADVRLSRAGPSFVLAHGECSQNVYSWADGRVLRGRRLGLSGKGRTASEARERCIAEGIERASLFHQGNEPRVRASFDALGSAAVDPRSILLFSDAQYASRGSASRQFGFHYVPEPFDPAAEVDWIRARRAISGENRYVLAELCYLGYGPRYAGADTNGCAAGRAFEGAAMSALAELVERDSVAIWWYNRIPRPALDTHSLRSPMLNSCATLLRRLRREWWLLDLTSDFELPVVLAVSCDADGGRIALGSGASPDIRIAAAKAVSEMAAHSWELAASEAVAREAEDPEDALWSWWKTARLEGHGHLQPAGESPSEKPGLRLPESFSFWADRLDSAGIEIYLVDHTRPELETPVVRVLAPGLRHWWARFASGRLYDVPVRMGWRQQPLPENQLNPTPYFL